MIEALGVPELLIRTLVAVAIGGLIGLEREQAPRKFAGLRTLALLCGAAPITVHLSEVAETSLIVVVYLALAGTMAIAIAYIRFLLTGSDMGFTTSVTVFLVALLGTLVGYGYVFEATAIALLVTFLLIQKERLHRYVDRLTHRELIDSMKLAALVFVLYPILPTEPIDPLGVVNPRDVLLFAVFVLLIQFLAYVSMRQFGGSKGLQVTGLLAGAVNSFAAAGVLSRTANQHRDTLDAASAALLLATVSMIVRNVAIASVLAVAILWVLWLPATVMVVLAATIGIVLLRRGDVAPEFEMSMESPFSFSAAAKFAIVYVAILLIAVLAQQAFGDSGLLLAAFVGGLVSSAAVAVSAATVLSEGTVGVGPAAGMVLVGIVASLCSKIVLVSLINRRMRLQAALPMAVVGVAGLAVYLVL